jgi:hypothetical protein
MRSPFLILVGAIVDPGRIVSVRRPDGISLTFIHVIAFRGGYWETAAVTISCKTRNDMNFMAFNFEQTYFNIE